MSLRRSVLTELQAESLIATEQIIKSEGIRGFTLGLIDQMSYAAWYRDWYPNNNRVPPNGGWEWPLLNEWCNKKYSRMGVALWDESRHNLLGLACARTNKSAVVINFLEKTPIHENLRSGQVAFILFLVGTS